MTAEIYGVYAQDYCFVTKEYLDSKIGELHNITAKCDALIFALYRNLSNRIYQLGNLGGIPSHSDPDVFTWDDKYQQDFLMEKYDKLTAPEKLYIDTL